MASRVPKTRNAGTMTEAAYWGKVRSLLRKGFMYWKPMQKTKEEASRPYKGPNKRLKKEYKCAKCKKWFKGADVQIDHIIEAGSLRCSEDLAGFLERLTPEDPKAYQVLCKPCHQIKTNKAREKK